jgi:hypothetical protein
VKVYRKPATAEWHYDSAQKVDEVEIGRAAWIDECPISFDGTKDKAGDRHTTMRIVLEENEVERLYSGLIRGRNEKLRLEIKARQEMAKRFKKFVDVITAQLKEIDGEWQKAEVGSEAERAYDTVRKSLRKSLDDLDPGWRWV